MVHPLLLGLGAVMLVHSAGLATEQTVEAIVPSREQRVEVIVPAGEQRVDPMTPVAMAGGEQQVDPLTPPSPTEKAASTASKVVTGVFAAAAALGATAAMLLFL